MITKTCDRCGALINPPCPWTQATTRIRVVVSNPRYVTPYELDLCYECQKAVFFFANPTGEWYTASGNVKQGEKERGKGENSTSFHERLKELRTESGMSQKEFAASLNVSPSKYNKWENGVNAPDLETISSLATHFNVSVDYLFGRTP